MNSEDLAAPFEFIIDGSPVSQQTRNKAGLYEWREKVRLVAEQHWPAEVSPVNGPVMFTIMYFYDRRALDVDNVPKPILDALKGLVFLDDNQVTDLVCRKRYVRSEFRGDNTSRVLSEAMDRDSDFLYVTVEEAPNQEVIE